VPVLNRSATQWSHSQHCVNFAYVKEAAQKLQGKRGTLNAILVCIVAPIGGCLADMYGRKPMMLLGCLVGSIQLFLYLASTVMVQKTDQLLSYGPGRSGVVKRP
jgi:hypothetical protein